MEYTAWGMPLIEGGFYWVSDNGCDPEIMRFSRGKWQECGWDILNGQEGIIVLSDRLEYTPRAQP